MIFKIDISLEIGTETTEQREKRKEKRRQLYQNGTLVCSFDIDMTNLTSLFTFNGYFFQLRSNINFRFFKKPKIRFYLKLNCSLFMIHLYTRILCNFGYM